MTQTCLCVLLQPKSGDGHERYNFKVASHCSIADQSLSVLIMKLSNYAFSISQYLQDDESASTVWKKENEYYWNGKHVRIENKSPSLFTICD